MRTVVPALAIVSGLGIATLNALAFAEQGRWGSMVLGGMLPPILGLAQWWSFRRNGGETQRAADSMIWTIILAAIALMSVLDH